MESKPKLHYFDLWGRAEPIRLLFSHLKVEYEEEILPYPYVPEIMAKYNFGKVPMLRMDGMELYESKAILTYIALKHGLHPTDPVNNYKVNSLVDRFIDLEFGMVKIFEAKEEEKEEAKKQFNEKELAPTLAALEKRLKDNVSQEYLVGDKLTVADVLYNDFVWSHALGPMVGEEQRTQTQAFLGMFPLFYTYVQKRKADFPRIETREPRFI